MEIKDVTFSYDKKLNTLHGVNGAIETGKVTTIIGPNGCGKSTLLGVLSNHHRPQEGEIVLDGKSLTDFKPKELAKRLAVVHQQNNAPSDMTVEKLTAYGRIPYKNLFSSSTKEDEEAVEWALTSTNLLDKRKTPIDELSGGQMQRVWIAMALTQKTPYLFLDEPTTYLDIYYQYELLELIRSLNKQHGITIVMVLHDINQAIQFSDTIIAMKDGKIAAKGAPADVITADAINEIYGVQVVVKHDEQAGMYIVPVGI
ncbi:ABC transporter ATP-binding protein [Sporosarcina thermotolerans]|uniref:ABC transporter ATP-binding protein n=1 Tax=Sporosarcina thermotolerans TaxID=633404 RepID=A0AAW9A6Y3_9BACL|nr:ABC transporter ATP-binding protein [Sporosarcina thermotolerans]MDW0116070.1 ABC transporter ATP-binding protein [Sporosarcina thermotolerans]WHT48041.1 ABC transporter ATP-binding protein [Sporosarcina thermotolerans]